jgi:hypothetical protein
MPASLFNDFFPAAGNDDEHNHVICIQTELILSKYMLKLTICPDGYKTNDIYF